MIKKCLVCSLKFNKPKKISINQWHSRKYCSVLCAKKDNSNRMKKQWKYNRKNFLENHFCPSGWNKGLKNPNITGEKHFAWKGENAGYFAKHKWINKHLGKPDKCSNPECHYPRKNRKGKIILKPSKFEWANIDHKYRRIVSDYIRLCTSCHRKYDRDILKIKVGRY